MVFGLKRILKWKGKWWQSRRKKADKEELQQTENEMWLEYYGPYLHIWPFRELCARLEANVSQGLTSEAAGIRLARNGKNVLPLPLKQDVRPCKFLKDCFSVLGIFILLSSIACFAIYYIFEINFVVEGKVDPEFLVAGIILLLFFFLAGLMLHLQGDDNEEMFVTFDELMPMYCTVIRDGEKEIILTQDVVIGDILPISYGQRLPADLRFYSASGLEVNNVALTGYSKPVQITPLAYEGRQRYSRVEYII
ncbi:sodium/potassium-transporting ATPase subunit alpha-1 [Drosophila eugracilis]|uniref:sodium/potassium-transporting ATPase subunit alpha-1 n=1 Tax=Drosophila eugracilis TaxID=29029 RepID=UPI0007E88E30|nr:sodium/potassium-transporting ATPase subunit alpha-1 [Drosophila eugracilis]